MHVRHDRQYKGMNRNFSPSNRKFYAQFTDLFETKIENMRSKKTGYT